MTNHRLDRVLVLATLLPALSIPAYILALAGILSFSAVFVLCFALLAIMFVAVPAYAIYHWGDYE